MYRDDGEDDDDAAHPGWGVDERLLRFRAGPPAPREDPGAIRGRLPTFTGPVDDAPVGPQEVPGAQLPHRATQPSIAEMMADPMGTLSALPEHTQRLVLAQSMLSQQQILMGELARRRHWEQERWMHCASGTPVRDGILKDQKLKRKVWEPKLAQRANCRTKP